MSHKRYHTLCFFCKHFDFKSASVPPFNWRCIAFPEGIPEEIGDDLFDHRNPYPGDNDTQFEMLESLSAFKQRECFRNYLSLAEIQHALEITLVAIEFNRSFNEAIAAEASKDVMQALAEEYRGKLKKLSDSFPSE